MFHQKPFVPSLELISKHTLLSKEKVEKRKCVVPIKKITSVSDLDFFLQSQCFARLMHFLIKLCQSVENKKISDALESSPVVSSLIQGGGCFD